VKWRGDKFLRWQTPHLAEIGTGNLFVKERGGRNCVPAKQLTRNSAGRLGGKENGIAKSF
jgi:hypothetical protein